MTELTEFLADEWGALGPMIPGPKPGPAHETLRGRVPTSLFDIWEEFGFSGIDNGRFWLCDPLEWQDAADAWTEGVEFRMPVDHWTPVVRGAFGHLELLGSAPGATVTVVPLRNEFYPSDNTDLYPDSTSADDAIESLFSTFDSRSFPMRDDATDKPLFEECLAAVGPVGIDTMYTFLPVPALGGQASVTTVALEKAIPHLLLLRSLEAGEVRGDIAVTERDRQAGMDEWISGS